MIRSIADNTHAPVKLDPCSTDYLGNPGQGYPGGGQLFMVYHVVRSIASSAHGIARDTTDVGLGANVTLA